MKRVVVTGGAGFIGSALVRELVSRTPAQVLNLDLLTYAGNLASLSAVEGHPRYHFEQIDIADPDAVRRTFASFRPDTVFHLAAESHVDRSIDGPEAFVRTNVLGTFAMLEAARAHCAQMSPAEQSVFRFLLVSTDEVFGSLGPTGLFSEDSAYDPRSPYAATKASADHLARAWYHTFQTPVLITNCSNNYGPYQFPEKLIPVTILSALQGAPIPVYGEGTNVRDWLFVEDHVRALIMVAERGRVGSTYNVGGSNERTNLAVVRSVCEVLDDLIGAPPAGGSHADLITFVEDRPGHDRRYAIDASKLRGELGWSPSESFDSGLRKTVQWYLDNRSWWEPITRNQYRLERLGLSTARV